MEETGQWYPGPYGPGLNIVLGNVINTLAQNSKRLERDFCLHSVQAFSSNSAFGLILGTQLIDWMSDYVRFSNITGNAVLPHFVPGGGQFIRKGDFLVVKTRNDLGSSSPIQITMLFQGEYL